MRRKQLEIAMSEIDCKSKDWSPKRPANDNEQLGDK